MRCLIVGVLVYAPTYKREHRVPASGTESGVEQELAKVHARESGRNADKLSYGRYKTTEECRSSTVFTEEGFRFLYLLAVDEAHMANTAVGKAIDDRTSEPFGEIIIDECT